MRGSRSRGTVVDYRAALYPDLIVVANGWQLVLVQTEQTLLSAADHVLPQLVQWCVGKELSPALNISWLLTELVSFGSQVYKSVKISTVPAGPRVAAIYPVGPMAKLLFALLSCLKGGPGGP